MTGPSAVAFRKVNKWYGHLHVLKNINLMVAEGERLVLCGPSGSGKSTLVYCINGLEEYQSGDVVVHGIRVSEDDGTADEVRPSIGMVFQQFNLFPHMTILDNCTLAPTKVLGAGRAEARDVAMAALERVHIVDQAGKFPSQLSGGQQQRAAIARALAMKPRLILFDEPTSALDPEMVKEVLDTMVGLADDGITMICVTHEMGFAQRVADRIVMMEKGGIVEDAPPSRFFDRDQGNPRVKAFLDQIL